MILIDNNGYKSIGSLSRSLGSEGFGTRFLYRNQNSDKIDGDEVQSGDYLPVDLATNAKSLGAEVIECYVQQSDNCSKKAKSIEKQLLSTPHVIAIKVSTDMGPYSISEVSEMDPQKNV